ncbi:helix-turn-helix domain-containing protein [Kitasatospora sp. NPDC017646]|uniref:helix-turn-helix domain-containing protein n=1 Tax=Kitasatospora sp. NPDC017646 TaxID=3364024 RepID=UPI00379FFCF7
MTDEPGAAERALYLAAVRGGGRLRPEDLAPADRHLVAPHPTTVRIGRLLARGLTQRAVATRLGISERTVAGHISRLRDRYGARTLFHLGWHLRGEHHG